MKTLRLLAIIEFIKLFVWSVEKFDRLNPTGNEGIIGNAKAYELAIIGSDKPLHNAIFYAF